MSTKEVAKRKTRRELELEVALLKEKNIELTERLKKLRNARAPVSKIKKRIQTIRSTQTNVQTYSNACMYFMISGTMAQ